MEKIIFKRIRRKKDKKHDDHPIRIKTEIYQKMKNLSEATRIPLTHLAGTILEFALPYVEVKY